MTTLSRPVTAVAEILLIKQCLNNSGLWTPSCSVFIRQRHGTFLAVMANRYLVRALRNRDMKVSTLRPPMETFPSTQPDRVFRFGLFELSERDAELRKNGVRIKLQEQPLRVLLELVAKPGKVVSREDLQQKLWPADTFVDFDVGLNTAIRKLRQALNDDADNPHYVETLARRGYRFVAQVSEISSGPVPVN